MILFVVTIALGAFLLFLVEPLAAKILLPLFGGTSAVWLTSLLFFQLALLAGYLFADLLVRKLPPRRQTALHLVLLALAALTMPLDAAPDLQKLLAAHPRFWTSAPPILQLLFLLSRSIGLPFIALAATGPLAQSLWTRRYQGSPYRLYALSNLASLAGLAAYPFLLEPFLTLHRQALLFSTAFVLFAFAAAALSIFTPQPAPDAKSGEIDAIFPTIESNQPAIPQLSRALWLIFPACSSALLLSVTGHLTRNVAPIPLLWMLPLAAYLLSFVLAFDSPRWISRLWAMPLAIAAIAFLVFADGWIPPDTHLALSIAAQVAAFFFAAVALHGELVRLRPEPSRLTGFYLAISLGSALGSLAVAVLIPLLFKSLAELALSLVAASIALTIAWWPRAHPQNSPSQPRRFSLSIRVALLLGIAIISLSLFIGAKTRELGNIFAARNFYGALHVQDQSSIRGKLRVLFNGNTMHGVQLTPPVRTGVSTASLEMLSYYSVQSGVGRALIALRELQRPLRVGAIGLGAGILAGACLPGDAFEFYEINPLVERVAREQFTFLAHCPSATVSIGDARLVLESEKPQAFDLIVIDAFNSDSIPIHLLTAEAFALYTRHLAPGGIIAAHVSNRYLDLEPAVAAQARPLGLHGFLAVDNTKTEDTFPSEWVLLSADPTRLKGPAYAGARIQPIEELRQLRRWTDDYSNIATIFR